MSNDSSGAFIMVATNRPGDLDEAVLVADRVVVMQHGAVQEIMDVPLPRPRGDIEALRGSAAFAETRYRLWRAINATAN